jgi:hypothetical protein
MAHRNEVEQDFTLKSAIRAILWSQGYSTRLDVLLAYDKAAQVKWIWKDFFSPELLGEVLSRLSRLPSTLTRVERYRETGYWMEDPYRRLLQITVALQSIANEGSNGPTFHLVFADFVWLYVIALWKTCESLNAMGLSRLERGLELMARCVRHPNAVSKMARRAEWLIVGQMVGNLGTPP